MGGHRERFPAFENRSSLHESERSSSMSVSEITETRQYLTFKLGNEIFATDVAKVR